ncbi:integral membrane protein [Colletotrichum tofieldiae]|nr:integral membrane protein [Colletotrichum tofieldiae]GKT77448.1 integral membrane protein [Colletotrichum tofieldiae]
MVTHQVIGLSLDLALMGLPIWVVCTNMLLSQRTFYVIVVFGTGIFVIVAGCIRLAMMKSFMFLADPTFNMSTIGSWTALEAHVGLWVAPFPALQPLVRIVSKEFRFRKRLHSYAKDGRSKTGAGGGIKTEPGVWAGTGCSGCKVQNGRAINATESRAERGVRVKKDEKELDDTDNRVLRIHKQIEVEVRVDQEAAREDHSKQNS